MPALNAGCVPPITSGFRQYLEVDDVSAAVRRLLRASESRGEVDAFDTHPPLRDRLAALSRIEGPAVEPAADPPAATLLPDAEALARRLVTFAPGIERCARLRVVGWQDLATEVYPTRWRQAAARSSAFLARYTPSSIPEGRDAFVAAGRELLGDADADDAVRFRYAIHVFSMGLGAALLDAGFTPETSPGRPVVFARSGRRLLAFDAVQDLADGRLTALEWRTKCRAAGIGELRLGVRAAA
jgi:hypothetical protein